MYFELQRRTCLPSKEEEEEEGGGDLFHLNPTKTQEALSRTQSRKVIYFLITQEELCNLGSSSKEDAMSLLIKDGTNCYYQKAEGPAVLKLGILWLLLQQPRTNNAGKRIHSKVGHG